MVNEKPFAIHYLIEGNKYSPYKETYVLENGDYEERERFPRDVMFAVHEIEKVKNGECGAINILDKDLYEVLKALYLQSNCFCSDVYSDYYLKVKEKIESLRNSEILVEDIDDYFCGNDFGFTLDVINPCFIELFKMKDCETNSSSIYCWNKRYEYVFKCFSSWLSEKGIKKFKTWHLLAQTPHIEQTFLLLHAFLALTSTANEINNSEVKTYVMKGENGQYKIGRSADPFRREHDFRCGNPNINLLFYIDCDIEKELHKKYADKCIGGEWFKLTEEDLKFIKNYKKKKGILPLIER